MRFFPTRLARTMVQTTMLPALLLMPMTSMAAPSGPLVASKPRVPEMPPDADMSAGFMDLRNPGKTPIVLIGASSPQFGKVEFHETIQRDGKARMHHLGKLTIPANGHVLFAHGGYHFMLIQPRKPLHAGDHVSLTIRFDGGKGQQTFDLPVVKGD